MTPQNPDGGRREPASAPLTSRARRTWLRSAGLALTLVAAGAGVAQASAASVGSAASAASAASVTAAPVAAASKKVELRLTRVSPAAVGPGTPLVVSGVLRNTSGATLTKPVVTLRLHQGLLDGRGEIDDWLGDGDSTTDLALPKPAKPKALTPNQSVAFTVTVPAGRLGLGTLSSFGPRGLTLEATAGATSYGTLRTTFVWMPSEPTVRTRLSLAVPLVETTPSTVAGSATPDAATSLEPGGHLDRVLTATRDKAVAWAVDPSVLVAAQRISASGVTGSDDEPASTADDDPDASTSPSSSPSGSPGPTTDPARAAATDWLSRFRRQARDHGLIALPYADPDLTATLRAKESIPLLTGADELGARAADDATGLRLDDSIAWPANGKINPVTAARLAENGRTAVILSASSQPPENPTTTTVTGRGTVETRSGSLDSLLYDDELSALFAAAGTRKGAAATQTFLAELAAVTREGDGMRHLLAVAPRTWNPDPGGVQAFMSALRSAPWVSLRGINVLRSTEPTVARTAVKYGSKAKNAELPPGQVTGVLAMQRDLSAFGPALEVADAKDTQARLAETAVVRTRQERIASLLSVAWRGDRTRLAAARNDVSDEVNELVDGVTLRGGKSPTLTGRSAALPMYIDNRTEYPVKVFLRLKPASGQVAFEGDIPVTVPASQLVLVQVPTRALANGNVQVEAKLVTKDGGQVGPSLPFTVKVRPRWETVGLIIVGSVLGLLFVLGLLRSIRRGVRRGRVPPDSVPDVDDLASRRADAVPNDVGAGGSEAAGGDPKPDPTLSSTDGLSHPDPDSEERSPESSTRSPAMPRETR